MTIFLAVMFTILTGCTGGRVQSVFAKEDLVNTKKELNTRIEEGMKQGKTTISFRTSELKKEDFEALNSMHDGFYGTVKSYKISAFEIFDVSDVTLYCEINDNYYVENQILNGVDIPDDQKSAKKLLKVCRRLIPKITADKASLYRREKRIHDLLVHNVAYGYPENDASPESPAYTAYGALVEKTAVCNGYAQAMKLLCDLTGVKCEMITGTGKGVNHAWNLVKLGKTWYHVDTTWDDPAPDEPKRILYHYFNVDDKLMAQEHTWDKEAYPRADGDSYNYFKINDLVCDTFADFRKKCEEIYEKDNPRRFQIMVKDYSEDTYSKENLQFLLKLSKAWSMSIQTVGEGSDVTLYFEMKD